MDINLILFTVLQSHHPVKDRRGGHAEVALDPVGIASATRTCEMRRLRESESRASNGSTAGGRASAASWITGRSCVVAPWRGYIPSGGDDDIDEALVDISAGRSP